MATLVQFGAGSIGRSFIGQLFSTAGYEIVFVDVAEPLVAALNRERCYRVVIKQSGRLDETLCVRPVRAVDGRDSEAVQAEVVTADVVCTAVGKAALPHVLPALAAGISARQASGVAEPLDIIFAENVRQVATLARAELERLLGPDFPLDCRVGLVESSIGKMVPIMREADLAADPLWVFAEPYNRLILDARAFRNGVPDVPEIVAVDNINAYVDRKLFIHNLGHAATAYLGKAADPGLIYVWEALAVPEVARQVRTAMRQAATALCREYPQDLGTEALEAHIDDLLQRFRNRALGDTIFRVGRDLPRKLGRDDRLVGAMLLAARHHLPFDAIAAAFRAALQFCAVDEDGAPFPGDVAFRTRLEAEGLPVVLHDICGLETTASSDGPVVAGILADERRR